MNKDRLARRMITMAITMMAMNNARGMAAMARSDESPPIQPYGDAAQLSGERSWDKSVVAWRDNYGTSASLANEDRPQTPIFKVLTGSGSSKTAVAAQRSTGQRAACLAALKVAVLANPV